MEKIIAYFIIIVTNIEEDIEFQGIEITKNGKRIRIDIKAKEPEKFPIEFNNTLDTLTKNKQILGNKSIEKIIFYVNFGYSGQCNWEFTSSEIAKLNKLNCVLAITCYTAEV